MISIYKDMSDLDPTRITEVVDLIERVFDEDNSGYVGESFYSHEMPMYDFFD